MTDSPATEPLEAHTLNEVGYYLAVTACSACGKGPWVVDRSEGPDPATRKAAVQARCATCGERRSFLFVCSHDLTPGEAPSETINPTAEPSKIIDLAQWLSLFHMLVESASSDVAPIATRRKGYQAALCLAEGLKFYGDDELPPPSAFFSPRTGETFRLHGERFARQRLRDMQAKLPSLSVMVGRVDRDGRTGKRRWWQFWRRSHSQ